MVQDLECLGSFLADPEPRRAVGEQGGEGWAWEAEELTSWAMPEAAGRAPCSAGRLSLGELQPDTGVLLLLGEESVPGRKIGENEHLHTEENCTAPAL